MGIDDSGDVEMRNAQSSAPEEEEHQMDTSDIKLDTVVLPEGVCLLDKAFAIIEKDPDGKKFDRGHVTRWSLFFSLFIAVSRFICRCSNAPLELLLDVNVDVYPLKVCIASIRIRLPAFVRDQ